MSFVPIYYYCTIKIALLFEKSGFIWEGINGKIDGIKRQFERSMVYEPFKFEPAKFDSKYKNNFFLILSESS